MMRASYYDPADDRTVELQESSENDIPNLLRAILSLHSQRGHPTLEFVRVDKASLSLSTNGEQAYLVWIDSLGESFHSVGGGQYSGGPLIFDYFDSWSEAPPQYLVSLQDALASVTAFYKTGSADTEQILFERD